MLCTTALLMWVDILFGGWTTTTTNLQINGILHVAFLATGCHVAVAVVVVAVVAVVAMLVVVM